MTFSATTYLLQTINFLVLVVLLRKFLYKPVLAMIDAKRERGAKEREELATLRETVEAERRLLAEDRAVAERERAHALGAANAQAEVLIAERSRNAELEARALVDAAKEKLVADRAAMISESRTVVLDLAVAMARRLLAEVPTEALHDVWLSRTEQRLRDMTATERQAVIGRGDGVVRIVTATPLSGDEQVRWRLGLKSHFPESVRVEFVVSPEIVAGVDIYFPQAVLRGSWHEAVEVMRKELAAHEALT